MVGLTMTWELGVIKLKFFMEDNIGGDGKWGIFTGRNSSFFWVGRKMWCVYLANGQFDRGYDE